MSENKTRPGTGSAADFIDQVSDPGRREDARTLCALMMEMTGEPPVLWGPSIIGFGSYHYRYDSGREGDAPAAGFSPRARELVVYLAAHSDKTGALLDRLGKHRLGKSCLYLKRLFDIDLGVLREVVSDSFQAVKARYPG